MTINSRVVGVGVPTGAAHTKSRPGTNRTISPGELETPSLALAYDKKSVSVVDVDLQAANVNTEIRIAGTLLFYPAAIDSTGAPLNDRIITVRFDRVNNPSIIMLPGMEISGIPFSRVFIGTPGLGSAGDVGQLMFVTDTPEDRVVVR